MCLGNGLGYSWNTARDTNLGYTVEYSREHDLDYDLDMIWEWWIWKGHSLGFTCIAPLALHYSVLTEESSHPSTLTLFYITLTTLLMLILNTHLPALSHKDILRSYRASLFSHGIVFLFPACLTSCLTIYLASLILEPAYRAARDLLLFLSFLRLPFFFSFFWLLLWVFLMLP
jgi:hypothetical protein